MAYCKRCVCGHVTVYPQAGQAPLRCSKCSRFIAAVTETVYVEAEEELKTPEEEPKTVEEQPEAPPPPSTRKGFAMTLESPDGDYVLQVAGPMTVGRNAEGRAYLEEYPDVSRNHFTIEPRPNGITATLTDLSSMGTYVNGVRMVKGSSVAISNSTVLRLGNSAFLVVRMKEVDSDA